MTPEIRLAALCDHALVGQDGKVSILGVFRNISVTGLPAQHPRMFLVAILGLDAGTHAVVVRLRKPDVALADIQSKNGAAKSLGEPVRVCSGKTAELAHTVPGFQIQPRHHRAFFKAAVKDKIVAMAPIETCEKELPLG